MHCVPFMVFASVRPSTDDIPQMTFFPLDNIGIAIVSNMDDVADSFYPIVLYAYDLLMVRVSYTQCIYHT